MTRVARLGLFIFGTLAILAAGVFIIGSKEYLFRSTYKVKAQFDNVAGLAEGAEVQVGGVHSGMVESIELPHRPGDQVTVVMDLDKSTHEIIKADSVASIETEGMLGNQYVAISFGSAGQAELTNGEIIPEPTAADHGRHAQKGERDPGQQSSRHHQCDRGNGPFELSKRQD